MAQKIRHKRSGILNKKPNASQLELGEIAINFNDENPFISTLTNEGNVVEFPSKKGIQGLIDDALEEYQPGSGGTVDAYSKTETDQLLAGKSDSGHTHPQYLTEHQDISNLATKDELAGKSDSGHTHPQYLTEHQDISGKADKTDLENYQPVSGMSAYAPSSHTHSQYLTQQSADERYAQIGDTPTDVYTKSEVNDLLAGKSDSGHTHDQYLTEHQDISGKADKSELANYQPVSAMTGYLTTSDASETYQPKGNYLTEHQDISGKADKTDLANYQPVSAMTAYAPSSHTHPQYVTSGDVETMMSGKTNIWTGTLEQYQALEEKDNNTIYCITDTNYQYLTLTEAEELFQPVSGMTDYQPVSGMSAYSQTGHTHDQYLTEHQDISGKADKTDLANYQPVSGMSAYSQTGHTHSYNDLEDKPTIPSVEGLATKAELENYQPVSGMSGYSQTGHTHSEYSPTGHTHTSSDISDLSTVLADYSQTGHTHSEYSQTGHTHSYNDLEDKPTIPSTEGLATKQELGNYQPVSGMTDYQPVSGMSAYSQTGHTHSEYSQTGHTHTSGDVTDLSTVLAGYSQTGHTHSEYSPTGHTHSEYLTQTSADSRYARVVSISQSDYDTLVSNNQVQQGVLYCIIETSN